MVERQTLQPQNLLPARAWGFESPSRHHPSSVLPRNRVSVYGPHANSNCIVLLVHSNHVVCLFPQHAPGMKHLRHIELAEWQRPIVSDHATRFVRGLLHSDGCRFTNPVTHTRSDTSLRDRSSRTHPRTYSGCSQRRATDSASTGVELVTAPLRLPGALQFRCSTSSSDPSTDHADACCGTATQDDARAHPAPARRSGPRPRRLAGGRQAQARSAGKGQDRVGPGRRSRRSTSAAATLCNEVPSENVARGAAPAPTFRAHHALRAPSVETLLQNLLRVIGAVQPELRAIAQIAPPPPGPGVGERTRTSTGCPTGS
jgi:hypothetical protein